MPFLASAGAMSSFQSVYSVATSSRAVRWMALKSSVGLRPSGPTSLVSLSICCLMPATRISKNSSRFPLKMVRNLTRSMSGCVGSCASSRTRRLNSSQLSSRLMKFSGAEKRECCPFSDALGSSIIFDGSSGVEDSVFGCIAHQPRLFAEPELLEEAALLLFRADHGRRPAFHDLERKKAEEGQAREFEIEPEILGDLRDGTDAVELRSELRLRHGEPKLLHPVVAVARVGGDGTGFDLLGVVELPELDAAQGAERPMVDIAFARNFIAELRQRLALLEDEAHLLRRPKLREKFLAVMLHQLHGRLVQDQSLSREIEEKWAAGLALLRPALLGLFRVHIDERDRSLDRKSVV